MSRGYGTVREYRDDPDMIYRDDGQGQDPRRFRNSVEDVTNHVSEINSNTNSLERLLRQIGTTNDSHDLRQKIQDTEQRTNKYVSETTQLFKQLARMKAPDKQLKLQVEKLRGDFEQTVRRYSRLQQDIAEKVKLVPLQSQKTIRQTTQSDLIGWQDDDDQARLIENEKRRAELQVQDEMIETDLAVIQEREDEIRQLEANILDINDIFRELSNLVYEQGDMVDSIEANVERAHGNVEQGNTQLQQASKYASKYRKKLCICGIVLAVIVAIIIIVIVVEVKKNQK